ncbi:unnamed protein product [Euphydryas editha]|nr:unnamed protein product [Euphydryas editha]
MLDRIKACVIMLDKMRHPRMLQIIHSLEETHHTLAFASECVLGSLHNILAWHESSPIPPGGQFPVMPHPISLGPPTAQMMPPQPPTQRPPFAREYHFMDIELRFGLLQILSKSDEVTSKWYQDKLPVTSKLGAGLIHSLARSKI